MANSGEEPGEMVTRQVRQHLEGLLAAGVEWLPRVELPIFSESPDQASAAASPEAPGGVEVRMRELNLLVERVSNCDRCPELVATRTQTVFGVGPLDPDICFVGEAPGAEEDRRGEPFVGAAGELFDRILQACGIRRAEVFICNTLRCRPPGNRTPKPPEVANCREYLERTIEYVRPKYLCALGAVAAKNLLGSTQGIGALRGRFYEFLGIPLICTYHPASLLPGRSPENKRLVWEDMKLLFQHMGRSIPTGKRD